MAKIKVSGVRQTPSGAVTVTVPSTHGSRSRGRRVVRVVDSSAGGPVELRHGTESAVVPTEMADALVTIARAMAAGQTVTMFVGTASAGPELSSQAAADLLNVSRPYVVRLARHGLLRHRKVGNRHRFLEADVREYAAEQVRRRGDLLASIAPAEGYRPGDF